MTPHPLRARGKRTHKTKVTESERGPSRTMVSSYIILQKGLRQFFNFDKKYTTLAKLVEYASDTAWNISDAIEIKSKYVF